MRLILIAILLIITMPLPAISDACRYHISKLIGSHENYIMDYRSGSLESHEIEYVKSYWRHVQNIYGGRLNLADKEIESFVESSMDLVDRTILITNQKQDKDVFDGGVALVYSKNISEPLPFEKATGLSFPRDGVALEITRLTADHARDKLLARELLATIAKILEKEDTVGTMYAFTSKKHAILYKRSRIPHKEYKVSDRDVVLVFSTKDYIKAFLHTMKRKF